MNPVEPRYVRCLSPAGFHRMAYVEWGDPANPRVLVCVHGLTRCGRDFDFLAQSLAGEYRVVCPDVVGRGMSEWLRDPAHYAIPQYAQDMVALLARLDVEQVDWLGTSMGGMIGMALAAQSGSPVRRLILNDVGPVIAAAALARIGEYLAAPPDFASLEAAERYIRTVSAPFGPLDDAQWRHLTQNVVRDGPDGRLILRYDPGIAAPFAAAMTAQGEGRDVELWPLYEAIRCPTLVVRGALSDLLSRDTVAAMSERGPRAATVEVAGVGHAPMFLDDAQVAIVREFLSAPGGR
ncbi:MAG: alpha/beta hydrolase [Rhodocyclaceae bacterium]|jgi:pimeloyl-ACP methyl ester carboxylesterase|nr:alpha/beta hydrolase [Rhodocyclaceae bacterium]